MGYVPEAVQVAQRAGNYVDISLWGKKRIMKYIRPRSQPPSKEEIYDNVVAKKILCMVIPFKTISCIFQLSKMS